MQTPSNTSAAMPTDSLVRRVRMDGLADVGRVRAHLDRERELADQVAGAGADDAAADDAVRLGVEDELGEAFVARVGDRAARRPPRETSPRRSPTPLFFASSSVSPTQAISGSV